MSRENRRGFKYTAPCSLHYRRTQVLGEMLFGSYDASSLLNGTAHSGSRSSIAGGRVSSPMASVEALGCASFCASCTVKPCLENVPEPSGPGYSDFSSSVGEAVACRYVSMS